MKIIDVNTVATFKIEFSIQEIDMLFFALSEMVCLGSEKRPRIARQPELQRQYVDLHHQIRDARVNTSLMKVKRDTN